MELMNIGNHCIKQNTARICYVQALNAFDSLQLNCLIHRPLIVAQQLARHDETEDFQSSKSSGHIALYSLCRGNYMENRLCASQKHVAWEREVSLG